MRISRCPVDTREIHSMPNPMHFSSLPIIVMVTSEQRAELPLETFTSWIAATATATPFNLHSQFHCLPLPPMATNCCSTAARRLSDLLKEQQEPLLLQLLLQDHDDDATLARTPAASAARRRSAADTVTKLALRWADDLLAGCFPCAATRQRFRRLPRADGVGDVVAPVDCHDGAGKCGRQQLSPVSVLDLHSDDDSSPVPSHWDEHSDDDGNGKPSTSGTGTGPSRPSIHDLPGKSPSTEEKFQRKSVVSAWDWDCETVAADIFRIPSLVALDLSGSPRDDWRSLVGGGGEEEARQVARSIEAMIFEEVRWEAVRDMLCSPQH